MDSTALTHRIHLALQDRKAQDVTILDVRGRCAYADYLVLASGTSDRHVAAIAEFVDASLRQEGERSIGHEGFREGQWALIDFGHVVVHVFHPFTRETYDLEAMWQDAPRLAAGEQAGA